MRCSPVVQSPAMVRPSKLIRGCPPPPTFVFLLLLLFNLTASFLVNGAQAQSPPSQRETKDALRTVASFLKNEAGVTWLSSLAQSRSTPLSTDELMEALLGATRPGGPVWQAANTLRAALQLQAQREANADNANASETQDLEAWDEIVSDIEQQDDIICLYRKDAGAKMKKSDDWQKFLKTVSPGYTVHLALDKGHKYVICLKKINVPEVLPSVDPTVAANAPITVAVPAAAVEFNSEAGAAAVIPSPPTTVLTTQFPVEPVVPVAKLMETAAAVRSPPLLKADISEESGEDDCDRSSESSEEIVEHKDLKDDFSSEMFDTGMANNFGSMLMNNGVYETTKNGNRNYNSNANNALVYDRNNGYKHGVSGSNRPMRPEFIPDPQSILETPCSLLRDYLYGLYLPPNGYPNGQAQLLSMPNIPIANKVPQLPINAPNVPSNWQQIQQPMWKPPQAPAFRPRPIYPEPRPVVPPKLQMPLPISYMIQQRPTIPEAQMPFPISSMIQQRPTIPEAQMSFPISSMIQQRPTIPEAQMPFPISSMIQQRPTIPEAQVPLPISSMIQQRPTIPEAQMPFPISSMIQQRPTIPEAQMPFPISSMIQQRPTIPEAQVPLPISSMIQQRPTIPEAQMPLSISSMIQQRPIIPKPMPSLQSMMVFQDKRFDQKPMIPTIEQKPMVQRPLMPNIQAKPFVPFTTSPSQMPKMPTMPSIPFSLQKFLLLQKSLSTIPPVLLVRNPEWSLPRQPLFPIPMQLPRMPVPNPSPRPTMPSSNLVQDCSPGREAFSAQLHSNQMQSILPRPITKMPCQSLPIIRPNLIPNVPMLRPQFSNLPYLNQIRPVVQKIALPPVPRPMVPQTIFPDLSISKPNFPGPPGIGPMLPKPVSFLPPQPVTVPISPKFTQNLPLYQQSFVPNSFGSLQQSALPNPTFNRPIAFPKAPVLPNPPIVIPPMMNLPSSNGMKTCQPMGLQSCIPSNGFVTMMLPVLVPRNIAQVWQLLGGQGLHTMNQNVPCTPACPSPCNRPIQLQISVQGPVQDPIRINVVPQPGENVQVIGGPGSLMNMQEVMPNPLNGMLGVRRTMSNGESERTEAPDGIEETEALDKALDEVAVESRLLNDPNSVLKQGDDPLDDLVIESGMHEDPEPAFKEHDVAPDDVVIETRMQEDPEPPLTIDDVKPDNRILEAKPHDDNQAKSGDVVSTTQSGNATEPETTSVAG